MSPRISTLAQEERKEVIIDAAFHCIARKGFAGTSIDDIAVEASGSKGAIYNYYNSKDEIFLTLMERKNRKAYLELTYQFGHVDTADMKLRYLINTEFPLNILGPCWRRVRLEFILCAVERENFRVFWQDEEQKFIDLIEDIYRDGQQSGCFAPHHDIRSLAELFWITQNNITANFVYTDRAQVHYLRLREMEKLFIDNIKTHH